MDNNEQYIVNGRVLTANDLSSIKEISKLYPRLSRKELIRTICENLRWASAVLTKKEKKIEEGLEMLERAGEIKLPPKNKASGWDNNSFPTYRGSHKKKIPITDKTNFKEDIYGVINEFMPVKVEIADTVEKEVLWDEYIERYHELKYGSPFGNQLKYLITTGGEHPQYVGCMMFSASSWSLAKRDKWIGWTKEDRFSRLYLIVNNTRFLIFPWVKIKNLASYSLSQAARKIQKDWWLKHRHTPVLLETFVDSEKYSGVSYRAANWTYLGNTTGRGRNSTKTTSVLSQKQIYMYPLEKDFRKYLTGEKEMDGECI
ncbi:MAG: DUF4338 domain-containing protein [bacterium]|nr:DUF4338 domain-containing protein [bacterium]